MLQDEQPVQEESIAYQSLDPAAKRQRLQELATVFFRLGTTAFGGPTAHIALMDDEVVKRRGWMSREKLLDLLGVTNLIPGPNSTELAIHIGLERGGWRGLAIAGISFILPAMVLVWILAAIYVQFQTFPQLDWLLYGIKPVIIAIVIQALWKLGQKAIKNGPTGVAAIAVIALFALGWNEILLLVLGGVGVMLYQMWRSGPPSATLLFPLTLLMQAPVPAPASPVSWLNIFLVFLKIGSVLYGSGYVLLAFLQRDLVERTGWLTAQQLLDAVAIGQFTPGPVFTTATFIGYLLAGNAGALAATIGIFLPAFVWVLLVNPLVPKLRRSPLTAGFLDGVNAASLGLMAVVTLQLGQAALVDGLTGVLAIASLILVFRTRINSAWLVLSGGVIGFLARQEFGS